MKRPFAVLLAVILSAGLAVGCTSATALKNAQASFDKAKAAGAEAKAPYEYYAAETYLGLAQHETDEGDRAAVRDFAAKSEKYSAEALQKAGGGAK